MTTPERKLRSDIFSGGSGLVNRYEMGKIDGEKKKGLVKPRVKASGRLQYLPGTFHPYQVKKFSMDESSHSS